MGELTSAKRLYKHFLWDNLVVLDAGGLPREQKMLKGHLPGSHITKYILIYEDKDLAVLDAKGFRRSVLSTSSSLSCPGLESQIPHKIDNLLFTITN